MIESTLLEVKMFAEDVRRVVITGNTAMLYFMRGLNLISFSGLFGESFPASELFSTLTHAEIYIPRCISPNVGSDIVCGLYAARFIGRSELSMYVDAGTNSQIVLLWNKRILCGATAAGLAFEGASITMGMLALTGAVQNVRHTGYGIMCETISDAPPVGICGSGLISAASLLIELGELDESGYLETDPYELGSSGIHIHGRDIRALQTAKSSIAAGIGMLLQTAGIRAESLDRLVLAGGFGNNPKPCDAIAIGLIPKALKDKTIYVGNTALLGAVMCMYSKSVRQKINKMACEAEEIQLMETPEFEQLQTARMAYKPYQ
jgi:uncharacterized 2Fe-2S/4Fe-4S cluster protein (DUF4445 family)